MASERPSSMGDIPLIPFLFAKHYLLLKFLCIWGWATGGGGAGGSIHNTGTGTGTGTGAYHGIHENFSKLSNQMNGFTSG
jgi:hypothetical protein